MVPPDQTAWTEREGDLLVDLDRGVVEAGGRRTTVAGADADGVLDGYLALVYELRDVEPGMTIPIREVDLGLLADALEWRAEEIERELIELMREHGDAEPAGRGRRRLLLPAAGLFVALTALGAAWAIRASDSDPTPTPPSTAQIDETPAPAAPPGEVDLGPEPLKLERTDDGGVREVPPGG